MNHVDVLLAALVLIVAITVLVGLRRRAMWSGASDRVVLPIEPGRHRLDSVIDGDSLRVVGADQAIRLIGIDAPEASSLRFGQPESLGTQATAQLLALLPPGTIIDVELGREPTDKYNRALAYVRAAGVLINEAMVRTGMAYAIEHPPNTRHTHELEAAQAEAQAAGVGVWGSCPNRHRHRS